MRRVIIAILLSGSLAGCESYGEQLIDLDRPPGPSITDRIAQAAAGECHSLGLMVGSGAFANCYELSLARRWAVLQRGRY